MSKREKIIGAVVMALALVWSLMYLLPSDKKKSLHRKSVDRRISGSDLLMDAGPFEEDEDIDIDRVVEHLRRKNEKVDFSALNDPFKKLKPIDSVFSFSDLVLFGVDWNPDEPIAIINGKILKVGDRLSGFTVLEIREDEVILNKDLVRYNLKFPSSGTELLEEEMAE